METLGHGVFPDGEWECFGKMFATEEHHEHESSQISHLLGEEDDGRNFGVQSMFPEAGGNRSNMFYSFDYHHNTNNLQYISQEISHNSNCSVFMDNPNHTTNHYVGYPHNVLANNSELKLKRMLDVSELEVPVDDNIMNSCGNPKKKPRASNDVQRLCMMNAESKKSLKKVDTNGNEAEETSSSYNTSEKHNMCEENSGGATSPSKLTVNGKTRVSRGSATDPQSLYARKRRERINERLRTLQNLVPNGTKVDISTMLEEAIHYVKFLQLQIKLLSSDDLWMYSPIAYNGLDIGFLSQKISPPP